MLFIAFFDSGTTGELATFLISVAFLLGFAKVLGELARRWKQPAVLGEICAGIILGPTLLGRFFPDVHGLFFPAEGGAFIGLSMLITLAVILLLLVAGLEVDLSIVRTQRRATLLVSTLGLVLPFALGLSLAILSPRFLGLEHESMLMPFAVFVGIALSITALPIIAKILLDLNIAKSALGMVVLASAMINDLLGWIGFALVLAFVHASAAATLSGETAEFLDEPTLHLMESLAGAEVGSGAPNLAATIVLTILFIIIMLTAGRWLVNRTLPFVQAHAEWPGGVLVFVIVTALLCAAFTEWIGIHSIFGAFIAGVAIGNSRHLRERTRDTVQQFIMNIFAPLFFASIALRIDFARAFDPMLVLVILFVACAGKFGGCAAGARFAGLSPRESAAIGFAMMARGAMEIILGQRAYHAGLISEDLFVAFLIMAVVTTLMAGPLMRRTLQLNQPRRLQQVVTEKGFIPRLRATRRRESIAELAACAVKLLPQRSRREIFDAVWTQEKIVSTGLENGIAVPHARLAGLSKGVIVIGLSERGIDFDAPDGGPAHIICMLLTPKDDHTAQIELLNMVARAFHAEESRREALSARSFTEFLAALSVSGEGR